MNIFYIDLNTDELLAKRANMQRIKDFANQLKAHNKAVQDPTKRTLEAEKQRQLEIARNFQQSKVAKAAEFAKHVPKPKRVSNEVVSINSIRSNQPNVVASTRGTSKINSSSSAYRDKYLAHGFLNQHESCRHSLLADDYVSNDDDDEENRGFKIYGKDSNFQSKSIDPRINQHLPTRLELLESKYRESQRQIESIKQSFRK